MTGCSWLRALLGALTASALLFSACDGGGSPARSPSPDTTTPANDGTPASLPTGVIDFAAEPPPSTIYGADAGDFAEAGAPLASGDFNSDGRPDLLIGAAFGDGPHGDRQDAGEAYVIYGEESQPQTLDLADAPQDVTFFGASAGDNLGWSVMATDLNGDGEDDVVIGAPGVTAGADPRTDQGRVYIFFGPLDVSEDVDIGEDPQDFTATGAEGFSRLGHALTDGDVNGDGLSDLILGAPFAGREVGAPPGSPRKEAGEVYVIFGSSSGLSGELNIAFDLPDFMVSNEQRFSQFGGTVAAGDVNGDGIDDVIAGAPQMTIEGREAAGAVYVFFGQRDLGGRRFILNGEQDATFAGAEARAAFGFPLASADVNGDGTDDIVAGARGGNGPAGKRPSAGEAYALFGPPSGVRDLASDPPDVTIYGAGSAHLLPTSLALADVNGDTSSDILIATTAGPGERLGAGEVYAVLGGDSLPPEIDLAEDVERFSLLGAQPDDRLGGALTSAEHADGRLSLLMLAVGGDGPEDSRTDCGEVYSLPLSP